MVLGQALALTSVSLGDNVVILILHMAEMLDIV